MGVNGTPSILNRKSQYSATRSASNGSGTRSGGVTTGKLMSSNVIFGANRSRISRGASYTSLSRAINGRAVAVNVGGSSCCGKTNELSTAEKMMQWMQIAQMGMQMTAQIGSLFGAGKKSDAISTLNTLHNQNTANAGTPAANNTPVANSILASLQSLSANAENFSLTDIDYEATAKTLLSDMNGAKTSADLYKSITSAKAYKAQVSTRMAGMQGDVQAKQNRLSTLQGEAEGSIKKANSDYSDKKDAVGTAEKEVSNGKSQVDGARKGYDMAKDALKGKNEQYDEATKLVGQKETAYNTAAKELETARGNYRQAQATVSDCTQALTTATANTQQAKANLDALKAQLGTSTETAALQARIAEAQTRYTEAQTAEGQAKKNLENAQDMESRAKTALGDSGSGAVKAFEDAKSALTQARSDVSARAKEMKEAGQITESQYETLVAKESSVNTAETNLANFQTALETAKDNESVAKENLDTLKKEEQQLKTVLHDYTEMGRALEKLDDTTISNMEHKLDEMMKKEGTTRDKLQAKLDEQNTRSNDLDGATAGQRKRTERGENRTTKKLIGLDQGDASTLIAADQRTQQNNALNSEITSGFQRLAMGLSFGGDSGKTETINGHTVERTANGQYKVDGSEPVDQMTAKFMVQQKPISLSKMPEMPNFNFTGSSNVGSGAFITTGDGMGLNFG